MRFYKVTNMIKTTKILSSQKNKQFVLPENKPFLMSALLLKYPKFDQKLIVFIKHFLIKMFNSNNNNNNKLLMMLYKNIITFFDKTELYKLLGLKKDTDIYIEKLLLSKDGYYKKIKVINKDIFKTSRLNEKTKRCLYLYLYTVNYFFDYIGFPKLINILGKVLLYSPKEKKINYLKTMFNKLGKTYLTMLNINSLYSLLKLVSFFLMLKKILKSIYIIK